LARVNVTSTFTVHPVCKEDLRATASMPHTNLAFETALQEHIDSCAQDVRSFISDSTPDDVLRDVQGFETAHRRTRGRRYANRFSALVQSFQGFFSAVDAFVSSNPQVAGLVWGGLRFLIQVSNCIFSWPAFDDSSTTDSFPTFHLILRRLSSHSRQLVTVSTSTIHSYATELYKDSDRVMQVCIHLWFGIYRCNSEILGTC
jgi:hypothetical protein